MEKSVFFLLLINLVVIIILLLTSQVAAETKIDGFTADLISHDSPRSPFYNPSETNYQRLQKAFQRSILRGNHFSAMVASPNDNIESNVISGRGDYLMNISLGTPPVPMLGVADTGSDLIWRKCLPCDNCNDDQQPIFDPQNSQTYKSLSCDNEFCRTLGPHGSCGGGDNVCEYYYSYGDQSYSTGYLSSDTLTIGSSSTEPASFPDIAFGCAHAIDGHSAEIFVGLIGLGGGRLSLVMQLGPQLAGQFSYCLLPPSADPSASSKINFGSNGVVSGPGTVSTPLIRGNPYTFYYLQLEGMSVGSTRVDFNGFSSRTGGEAPGNIIIDSGTTLTLLPQDLYTQVESTVASTIAGQATSDPSGTFSLCYSGVSNSQIPTITAHFTGADVELPPSNTFIQVHEDLICFTMVPAKDLAIFGNLAQMNFLVGYDLNNSMVSFKPTDCTMLP